MKSAKEYIKEYLYITKDEDEDVHDSVENVEQLMINFAKQHAQNAFVKGQLSVLEENSYLEQYLNNIK